MFVGLTALISNIAGKGHVEDADILALRQAIFGDDVAVSEAEAEALLTLNDAIDAKNPAWSSLYVEALTDYAVQQTKPSGYVDQKTADWLVGRLMQDGRLQASSELELILRILDTAREVPASLTGFALAQIRDGVLRADGDLLGSQVENPGAISAGEVSLLRRVLYAAGGGGNIAITREEADLLFDLNDATVDQTNDPAWSDLFVKAVASHLMFTAVAQPPSRDDALRHEEWLETPDEGLFSFLTRGLKSLDGFGSSMAIARPELFEDDKTDEIIAANEAISADEAQWLAHRLDRDGRLQENERALLAFIKEHSPSVHPSLAPYLDRV
jgi:hypothetical protein